MVLKCALLTQLAQRVRLFGVWLVFDDAEMGPYSLSWCSGCGCLVFGWCLMVLKWCRTHSVGGAGAAVWCWGGV